MLGQARIGGPVDLGEAGRLPRSLHYAARRSKKLSAGKSRVAPVGMTEKAAGRSLHGPRRLRTSRSRIRVSGVAWDQKSPHPLRERQARDCVRAIDRGSAAISPRSLRCAGPSFVGVNRHSEIECRRKPARSGRDDRNSCWYCFPSAYALRRCANQA
jgi:hypothetical protein